MRTLVIHTGGVGDFVLTCPVLAHWAAQGPLEVAGDPERLELAVAAGWAQAAHDLDDFDFASVFTEASRRFRRFSQRFDRAFVWMRDDGVIARALRGCGVGEVQCFPGVPPDSWDGHAVDYFASCAGCPPGRFPSILLEPLPPPAEVVIHPGSGSRKKNWPAPRFEAIARRLSERGLANIACCLGPAEEDMTVPSGMAAWRCGGLVELARSLAGVRLFIGNDSGITHLAAAVGCPVVAVFGPTDPARWAPRGPRVRVVSAPEWPEADAVWRACTALLDA